MDLVLKIKLYIHQNEKTKLNYAWPSCDLSVKQINQDNLFFFLGYLFWLSSGKGLLIAIRDLTDQNLVFIPLLNCLII